MSQQRRTLTDEVRRWGDEELAALLAARPDLVSPIPPDLGALVSRACSQPSLQRALDGLDAFALDVVDAFVECGDLSYADLRAALLDPPEPALRATLDRLRALALVWGGDEHLHLVRGVRQLVPDPAELGPGLADLLTVYGPQRQNAIAEDLGVAAGSDPRAALVAAFADDTWLDRLLAGLGTAEREVLDALAWGPPAGRVPGALRAVRIATADTPVRRLLARALLVAVDGSTVILPREVALRLRGGRLFREVRVAPPPLATTPVGAPVVDRTAAGQAATFVRHVEETLEAWGVAPAGVLRAGGLGVRELRRLARDLDVEERHAGLLVETAYAAGLVAGTDAWLPTPAYDAWRREPPQRRWLTLADAWLHTTRVPGLIGERDDRDKPFNALANDLQVWSAPELRAAALGALAALPPGTGASVDSLVEAVAWSAPRRASGFRDMLVTWTLAEAEVLGVTGRAALASYARSLLAGDRDRAAAELAPLLPAPVDFVLLQADLTAVAPGPLVPELARELALAAEVESKGGATVYRFSAATVRRALDAGRSAVDLHALLAKHSRTPVPQPLTYLVDDVARRHGRIRVGSATAYLRCDDPAVLDELLATRKAADLKLRRLAPTVLAARAKVDRILEVLRGLGHAPAPESPEGELVVHRPDVRRAPKHAPPAPVGYAPSAPSRDMIGAAVRALRAGDRAAAVGRRAAGTSLGVQLDVSGTVTALQDAVADGRPVWISYVNASGQASQRIVEPLRVGGGVVEAYDHQRGEIRSFAIHRITGLAEVDDDLA